MTAAAAARLSAALYELANNADCAGRAALRTQKVDAGTKKPVRSDQDVAAWLGRVRESYARVAEACQELAAMRSLG